MGCRLYEETLFGELRPVILVGCRIKLLFWWAVSCHFDGLYEEAFSLAGCVLLSF